MEYEITKKLALDTIMHATNVAKLLPEADCKYIGRCAQEGYLEDKSSRDDWERRSARAMKLALQVVEQKSYPWPDCANVKIPVITTAALHYQARAYPALIDANDLVKVRTFGEDPDGQKTARADRIAAHMTWQNIRQNKGWEEVHDKGLLVQAIAGDAFIKTMFDPICRHNVTQLVLPDDFVINYYTKDLESSQRYTHVYDLSDNAVRQRELDGRFLQYDEDAPQKEQADQTDPIKVARDERTGVMSPPVGKTTPFNTGEQYCWWDLDHDGYDEPYIVTFDIASGRIRRIVARFLPSGVRKIRDAVYEITPVKVFTRIPFIPSPDGGFYSLGLGQLLGSINDSANTALNQIFDAGTMANLGGGFVGRSFKNRGGPFTFKPSEWYPVDAPGDDLRKNILPLPVPQPSAVLFQVLGMLLQYGERIVAANDIQMGENPGQNTPAETMRTLNENGSRVYSAIYKRTWRAFGEEYCVQYDLNELFLPESEDYVNTTTGVGAMIRKDDYRGPAVDIMPAADPYVVSDAQRVQQADQIVAMSGQLPGFNRYHAQLRALRARRVPNIDEIMPPPVGPDGKPAQDFPSPPNPKMLEIQIKQGELQLKQQAQQSTAQQFQINLQLEVMKTTAEINELNARAEMELATAGATKTEPAIKLIYAEIEAAGMRQKHWLGMLDVVSKHVTALHDSESGAKPPDLGQAMAGMSAPPALSNGSAMGTIQ